MWLMEKFGAAKPKLPQLLGDALASFAVDEDDVANIMTTLRLKLFSEPRLVHLPFDLVMMGTSGDPVLVMMRPLCDRLLQEIKRQAERMTIASPSAVTTAISDSTIPAFVTGTTRAAVNSLSEPLPARSYRCFAKMASLKATNVETRVQRALAATQ